MPIKKLDWERTIVVRLTIWPFDLTVFQVHFCYQCAFKYLTFLMTFFGLFVFIEDAYFRKLIKKNLKGHNPPRIFFYFCFYLYCLFRLT